VDATVRFAELSAEHLAPLSIDIRTKKQVVGARSGHRVGISREVEGVDMISSAVGCGSLN